MSHLLPVPTTLDSDALIDHLVRALACLYVRREQRFFHVGQPFDGLSRRDVEQTFIMQLKQICPGVTPTSDTLKRVFEMAIDRKHTDGERIIAVWNGRIACYPGNPNRVIPETTGAVSLNSWRTPSYRGLGVEDASYGIFKPFFERLFPREEERVRVLDWLAWCLQNEARKPNWSILLYSKEKGTGKSTFCALLRALFGPENSATQNNVDKLTSKFNTVPLTSKLIISEELSIKPESPQSNQLKTYITDQTILSERKGKEAERLPLVSCFIFTTNHLPTWLEEGERRYYTVDTGHDGHATGAEATFFGGLVGSVLRAMDSPKKLATLYNALMTRKLSSDFDPFTLNSQVHGTAIMKRLAASSGQTNTAQLEEFLNKQKHNVITQEDVAAHIAREFRVSGNATKHMMMELEWTQAKVKWGGVDWARAIWVRPGYTVTNGNIYGPDGSVEALCDHLALAGSETR